MLKKIQLKLNEILSFNNLLKIIIVFLGFSFLYLVLNIYYYKNYRNLNDKNKKMLEDKINEYIESKYSKLKNDKRNELIDYLVLNVPRKGNLSNKNFDNTINYINSICDQMNIDDLNK